MIKVRPRGFWHGPSRGWEFPFSAANRLRFLLADRFVVKKDLAEWFDWLDYPLPPLPIHSELIANADFDVVLSDGRRPLPHQQIGASWLLARKGALLADEMGLGKTLTALLAARAMVRALEVSVMVVAPAGLHAHWRQEASVLDLQIDLHSWASLPKHLLPVGTLLVVDEAHFAQSLKSKRTKALLRLARHPLLRAIWMLTGTPMKNGRPIELYPLLAAMNHPLAEDQRTFEKNFCNAHWREHHSHFVWSCQGVNNLGELSRLVRPLMLHRRKQDCLSLPPKVRKEHSVRLSKAESRGFDYRLSLVIDEYRSRVKKGLVQSEAESLVVLTALRQIASEYKLPSVSNFVNQFIKVGEPVIVFSAFIKPLKLLQNYLGGVLLTGQQSLKKREIAVNSFQKSETNLLLATYGTAGLGYTLHRARNVILIERPWTPADVAQAEDRCHRLGMNGSLTIHWFQLGLADKIVDSLLLEKLNHINTFISHEDIHASKRRVMPLIYQRLLQEL